MIRRFYEEVWNKGNIAVIDDIFAPDYVRHDLRPGLPPSGPEGQKAIARLFRAAFPDIRMTLGCCRPMTAQAFWSPFWLKWSGCRRTNSNFSERRRHGRPGWRLLIRSRESCGRMSGIFSRRNASRR
ncbi:MAG: ester cyclase [Chloroflexi bacterium]|nr:ester cyclase [Chloroflexota bacterium]